MDEMRPQRALASSIDTDELAVAAHNVVAARWDAWDLSPFLAYLVDVCAASALPYLAEQFDVDGLRGFEMAANEEQRRELIKKSIAMHKLIGTPWVLREACRSIGFPVILLEENVPEVTGGPRAPEDWARFRILVEADKSRYVTVEMIRRLRMFMEFYKPQRSHLTELGFFEKLADDEGLLRGDESFECRITVLKYDLLFDDTWRYVTDDEGITLTELLYGEPIEIIPPISTVLPPEGDRDIQLEVRTYKDWELT